MYNGTLLRFLVNIVAVETQKFNFALLPYM